MATKKIWIYKTRPFEIYPRIKSNWKGIRKAYRIYEREFPLIGAKFPNFYIYDSSLDTYFTITREDLIVHKQEYQGGQYIDIQFLMKIPLPPEIEAEIRAWEPEHPEFVSEEARERALKSKNQTQTFWDKEPLKV